MMMRRMIITAAVAAMLFLSGLASAQVSEKLLTGKWDADWVGHPDGPGHDPAVFLYRRTFELGAKPDKYIVHVSADQRYRLFVNGVSVANGPARGDNFHWRFETVDIAPQLKSGKNVLAAVVWSMGVMAPWAQHTAHNAFIMQADAPENWAANTPGDWKVARDEGWVFTPRPTFQRGGHVTGPNELVVAEKHPWGWNQPDFDDSKWARPISVANGVPAGLWGDGSSLWQLVPRPIPPLEEKPERMKQVVRTKKAQVAPEFVDGKAPFTIPAKTKAVVLLDREVLTNAYPEITVSGGKGARIRLSYEESLFKYPEVSFDRLIKGNRNDIKKCAIRENYKYDEFMPDGGAHRVFSPLWWRTFRFLQIDIETGAEPVTIEDFRAIFTGYPFSEKARFESSDPELSKMWEVGWRTARLCAVETYFDCPYYEQLQYGGDTRVQAVLSYYVAGDDRLGRNAIDQMWNSRIPEGLTQSRYPSRMTQIIPTFSLAWIGMIHDHYMFRGDLKFSAKYLDGMKEALNWFGSYKLDNGLLGNLRWWNFVDWSWPGGVPPGANTGEGSCVITLQYANALRDTADIEQAMGKARDATERRATADAYVSAVRKLCWNPERMLIADTPAKKTYSQHGTVLGVIAGAVPKENLKDAMDSAINKGVPKVMPKKRSKEPLAPTELAQCSLYFRYFLHLAADKAGLGDDYLKLLDPWRKMLALGMTTWPETPDETPRSDCHAWSTAPNIDMLSIICGVKPAAPGFAKVRIEPHLGSLQYATCEIPHPKGSVKVSLKKVNGKTVADVELPQGVTGEYVSGGKISPLKPGAQTLGK